MLSVQLSIIKPCVQEPLCCVGAFFVPWTTSMSLFSISFKLFICKSMKKEKNNNLQSCFFQKWTYRGYTLLVFSNAKLQGKIPWLWISLESFRGIYTTMSDVWVAAYFITSHTVHTVKINRFPRKMLNRYEKVESSSVTLIHIWFLVSLDVLLLFFLLIRTR